MDAEIEKLAQMTNRIIASQEFIKAAGWGQARQSLLAGDASNRRYDRLTEADGSTAIFMDAPPNKGEDVSPFVRIAGFLIQNGLSAPRILAQDPENGFLLIEDLGDALFARLMVDQPDMTAPLYTAATDMLVALHKAAPLELPICDSDWLVRMTDLVFDWYADDGAGFARFDALFRPLAQQLDHAPRVVILRDFHAENLLWLPERTGIARVGVLDFQDALLGHPAYDLVSILQDARRDVAPEIEAGMIARYSANTRTDAADFQTAYAILGVQRNLRILGIFARLCLRDGKAHYVDFIPRVWGYLQRNLEHPDLAELAQFLAETLPYPSPDFLEDLKARCATHPNP
jgi:aminoglycoside/choline kinase family phosphotransferase